MRKSRKSRTFDQMDTINYHIIPESGMLHYRQFDSQNETLQRTQFWLALHEFWCRAFFWLLYIPWGNHYQAENCREHTCHPVGPGWGMTTALRAWGQPPALCWGWQRQRWANVCCWARAIHRGGFGILAVSPDFELCLDGGPSKRACCKEKWWAQPFF